MRANGNEGRLGKRFAIVIGVAAAGVMALGAQTATSTTGSASIASRRTSRSRWIRSKARPSSLRVPVRHGGWAAIAIFAA